MPGAAGDFGRGRAGIRPPIRPLTRRSTASGIAIITCLLLAVIVPLSIYSDRSNNHRPQSDVQAAAGHWAAEGGLACRRRTATGQPCWSRPPGRAPLPALPSSAGIWMRQASPVPNVRVHLTVAVTTLPK